MEYFTGRLARLLVGGDLLCRTSDTCSWAWAPNPRDVSILELPGSHHLTTQVTIPFAVSLDACCSQKRQQDVLKQRVWAYGDLRRGGTYLLCQWSKTMQNSNTDASSKRRNIWRWWLQSSSHWATDIKKTETTLIAFLVPNVIFIIVWSTKNTNSSNHNDIICNKITLVSISALKPTVAARKRKKRVRTKNPRLKSERFTSER